MPPTVLPALAVIGGLILLVWSADRFVLGASAVAARLGLPPLLIGMIVVGFGTSAPELIVSAMAAGAGTPELALGNAYGSNITNIALILGVTALIRPIAVHSTVVRREIPILLGVTVLATALLVDGRLGRVDGALHLGVFGVVLAWSVVVARRNPTDAFALEMEAELPTEPPPGGAVATIVGLLGLLAASRALVWGAVEIATAAGVDELVIGLTVVALGTSLPEAASSIAAARRGEDDIAIGNVIGSNLFNTLAVVGLAAVIRPLDVPPELLGRDIATMGVVTVLLGIFAWGHRRPGRVNRWEGAALLAAFVGYTGWLVGSGLGAGP